ncbi:MAG: TRAP transporter substrate-binding protein [Burkholderiales bacterium]|nr:TRAP transporter substrate-binding protein [Burkholderiales bacterium]
MRPFAQAATLLAAATLSFGVTAQVLPKTTLNVVGNLGITTQSKELEQPFWTKVMPQVSGGAVSGTIKPWNEMGLKGPEVFKLLRQGLYDIAATQLGFLAGENAINDATDLAGVSTSLEQFWEVTTRFRPTLESFYEKQGLKVLALTSFQAQVLYCKNEMKSLADLKGRKVRVSGASQADFIEFFGGSGINMAFGDVQQALVNGVIDCAITGTLGGYKAKWFEGARALYPLPINWGSGMMAANTASWNKLDAGVRNLIMNELAKYERQVFEQNKRENDIGLACNTGGTCGEGPAAKMALIPIAAGDTDLRRKPLLESVLPKWGKRCGADCVKSWNDTVGRVVNLQARAN